MKKATERFYFHFTLIIYHIQSTVLDKRSRIIVFNKSKAHDLSELDAIFFYLTHCICFSFCSIVLYCIYDEHE